MQHVIASFGFIDDASYVVGTCIINIIHQMLDLECQDRRSDILLEDFTNCLDVTINIQGLY